MPDMGDLDPGKELERKTLEYLVETGEALQRQEITAHAFEQRLHAVWGVTAGLVSKETMEEVAAYKDGAARDTRNAADKIVMTHGAKVYVLFVLRQRPVVTLTSIENGEGKNVVRDFSDEDEPWMERRKYVASLVSRLRDKGATYLTPSV